MKELFRKTKDKGADVRLNLIERVIQRMSLRLHKTVTSIISPQPISICISGEDVKGDILKQLLFKGKINKCIVLFNGKPREPVCISIKCLNDSIGVSKDLFIDRAKTIHDLDIDTIDGSMLNMSIYPTGEKYKITEVWIGLLWTPHISNSKINQHLIDDIEKNSL